MAFTNVLPAGVTLVSASASQGTVLTTPTSVIVNLGTLNAGRHRHGDQRGGSHARRHSLGLTNGPADEHRQRRSPVETDLNPVNNSVSVVTTVNRPVADVGLTQTVAPDPVVVGYT